MHCYVIPTNPDALTEIEVHAALEFLVAIEAQDANSMEEYRAAMAPYREQTEAAMAKLRSFAEQTLPNDLRAMQDAYYGFTNAPRYLRSSMVSSVVTSALSQAWHGVGPWRR